MLAVREGGLLSYGPNQVDNFRRAASYVDRILRGAKLANLPVRPAGLTVNSACTKVGLRLQFAPNDRCTLDKAQQVGLESFSDGP